MEHLTARRTKLVGELRRKTLDPITRAEKIEELIKDPAYPLLETDVALAIGYSLPWVSNHLRLLRLPSFTANLLRRGALTFADGKALANLTPAEADWFAETKLREKWTSRTLEEQVAQYRRVQTEKPAERAA
jgi:ParB family chromosome partitioning protein